MSLDRASLVASVAFHVVALVLLWAAPIFQDDPVLYEVVHVQIYSPPPTPAPLDEETAPPEPDDELIVETPDPEPPAEEPEPEIPEPLPVEPDPEPEAPADEPEPDEPPPPEPSDPDPPTDPPPPTTEPPPEDAPPSAETEARENAEEGGLDMNVRQEAFSRDYPEYYDNLVVQIRRCFRPPSGNREAMVSFVVLRDGTTDEIGMARSSGSAIFDLAAQEATECAGKNGRLGPLPDDYPLDVLPVRFRFSPSRR